MIACLVFSLIFAGSLELTQSEQALQVPEQSKPASGPAIPGKINLRVGTPVRLRLLDKLSTKVTQKGETFDLEVIEDVKADGWVLIPAGTRAVGEVTRSDAKGAFGKSGKLEARILYLTLDGRAVRLSGALGVAGEGGTTETVLTAIAIGSLAFAVTGKSAVLDVGTELIARTDRSIALQPIKIDN